MSTTKTPLLPGHWYHIYNRGINGERLFHESKNYPYFLGLMVRHLIGSVEVYAYCLLSNHFHLLIRILDEPAKSAHQVFSNLFNSYAQSINKCYGRTGSLFERPFHRKKIDSEIYRAKVAAYIHHNPTHHRICDDFRDFPYSSYPSMLSTAETHLMRREVLDWFGGQDGFIEYHQRELDFSEMKDIIIENWRRSKKL
jgi:putative transposase